MQNLRSNSERARNAIILIWCVLVLEIASLISGYLQYNLLQTVVNGGEISIESANANDIREKVIGIIYMVFFLVSAIIFIQWFRRAYFNLHQWTAYLSYSEGWAAGCWFVPILNWFRPYQIMKELYQKTKELLVEKDINIGSGITIGVLGWWWALWILNSVLGQVVYRYSLRAESIQDMTMATIAGMVSNIMGIPLALITIKVIKDYSRVEPLLFEIKAIEEIAA